MRRHYFFRKGDLIKWLRAYVRSKAFVIEYKYYGSSLKTDKYDEFKEADRITREFRVLMCSLDEKERNLINNYFKKHSIENISALTRNISINDNWEEIVLKTGNHNLKEIDIKLLGIELQELRELNCLYRVEVARHLNISENTLRSYEEGTRTIRIDTFYELMQLYDVDNITKILIKCHIKVDTHK